MNAVGRILVALNLVMATVFLGFAVAVYATHKNWQEVVTLDPAKAQAEGKEPGLKHQLAKAKEAKAGIDAKYSALQSEIVVEKKLRDARLAILETEKEKLKVDVDAKVKEIEQIAQDKKDTAAAIEKLTLEVGKKSAEVETLTQSIETLKGDIKSQFEKVLKLTDDFAKAQSDLKKASDQNKQLVADVTRLKIIITSAGINPNRTDRAPEKVDGVVRASTPDGLVEISLGSDDGVQRGHMMEVWRPGPTAEATKYLGRIEILSTTADAAVGKVVPQFRKGNIEKDDRVASRFN